MNIDLAALGWNPATGTGGRRRHLRPGRVARVDRGVCTVLCATGAVRATLSGGLLADAARDRTTLPCTGDWVLLGTWPDARVTIEVVLPRRAALVSRADGRDAGTQVLAANMDFVAVVEPVQPAPDEARIERLIALASSAGVQPVIVLTRSDLVADPAAVARRLAGVAPGVPVLPVSTRAGTGLAPLREMVTPGVTLALLGPAGAGRSSLVDALVGASVLGTQAVRAADGARRHTTTGRALVLVPGGGVVIDTPGLRSTGLLDPPAGTDRAFDDVAGLARRCRSAGCGHRGEPGCAVRAALDSGELTAGRWESWRAWQREVAVQNRRRAVRLAAGERPWRTGRFPAH